MERQEFGEMQRSAEENRDAEQDDALRAENADGTKVSYVRIGGFGGTPAARSGQKKSVEADAQSRGTSQGSIERNAGARTGVVQPSGKRPMPPRGTSRRGVERDAGARTGVVQPSGKRPMPPRGTSQRGVERDTVRTGAGQPSGKRPMPPHGTSQRGVERNTGARTVPHRDRFVHDAERGRGDAKNDRFGFERNGGDRRRAGDAGMAHGGETALHRPQAAGNDAQAWTQVRGGTGGYVPPQWKDGTRHYTVPQRERGFTPHTSSEALKRQNPANRREQNRIDHRQNTEQMRRRNRRVRFRVVRKERISVRKIFRLGMLIVLVYALMMGGVLALLAGNLIRHAAGGDSTVVLQMGENSDENRVRRYLTYSFLFPDGEMYLNMTDIATACGLTTTGDLVQIRYLTRLGEQDVIRLEAGSSSAYINGEYVPLTGPVVVRNELVYLPASFIQLYTEGLTVEYNEKRGKITVTRNGTPELSGSMRYDPLSILMKAPACSDWIDWDLLDAEIRLMIEGKKTDPPETDPPETDPPETNPPETNPPETNPPETDSPETNPPETTDDSGTP